MTEAAIHVKETLNSQGCAYGQVTRERVDHLADDLRAIKSQLWGLLLAVLVQLIVFVATAFWFVANRTIH